MYDFIWILWDDATAMKLLAAARRPKDGNSMLSLVVVLLKCGYEGSNVYRSTPRL